MNETHEWWKRYHEPLELLRSEIKSCIYLAPPRTAHFLDCFARGILRTPNRTAKLNDAVRHFKPTQTKVIAAAPYGTFVGEAFLATVEQRVSLNPSFLAKGLLWVRNPVLREEPAAVVKNNGPGTWLPRLQRRVVISKSVRIHAVLDCTATQAVLRRGTRRMQRERTVL